MQPQHEEAGLDLRQDFSLGGDASGEVLVHEPDGWTAGEEGRWSECPPQGRTKVVGR